MVENTERYSDSIQSFPVIRESGLVYVDKTELIYHLVKEPKKYFLSRPRRFGKSLLLSTIESYFLGKRQLFKGLAIERLENDWTEFPVIHIDFNIGDYSSLDSFFGRFDTIFSSFEKAYGIKKVDDSVGSRFENIVISIAKASGKKVVVLVDEYDKPLVENLGNDAISERIINVMRDFYSVIKSQDANIRFALITGVMRFRHLSMFSGPNNLTDISMRKEYATLCGITEEELKHFFPMGIENLSAELGESVEETLRILAENYDGYRFYQSTPKLYNPYSLIQAFSSLQIENYWSYSGTPKFLVRLIWEKGWLFDDIDNSYLPKDYLLLPDTALNDPLPLMFQTGYLTIKDYDPETTEYLLTYPNKEVKQSFLKYLALTYFQDADEYSLAVASLRALRAGDLKVFMQGLERFLADIPFDSIAKIEEDHFHNFVFLLCRIIGLNAKTEYHTSDGSIDMTVETSAYFYIIEFKIDRSAEEALKQIERKNYAAISKGAKKKTFLIGVNFSTRTRRIDGWDFKQM